jgi:hypothetical protein
VKNKKCKIYFSDIAEYPSADAYEKAIESDKSSEKIKKDLINQIWANSVIAEKKYYAVSMSILTFIVLLVTSIIFMFTALLG